MRNSESAVPATKQTAAESASPSDSSIPFAAKDLTRLYSTGYFAAWLGLLSFIGGITFEIAARPPEGFVSDFDAAPLVIVLRVYFMLTFVFAWSLAVQVKKHVPRNGSFFSKILVAMSCGGPVGGVLYLFAALPAIRPNLPRSGA